MESSMRLKMLSGFVQLSLLILLFSTGVLSSVVHIVYMGQVHSHLPSHEIKALHHTMLASTMGSSELVQDSMIYSYTNSFSGFAAKLTPEHVNQLLQMDEVLSVFPNKALRPQTTHTWKFLGVESHESQEGSNFVYKDTADSPSSSLWSQANFGADIIIGMVDTGIWPESESFKDDGFPDIPTRWNGACVEGQNFSVSNCNKKLIGAKWFAKGFEAENGDLNLPKNVISPRDTEGHGTHTSSTAGGNMVANVSASGFARGTAKGGAPKARIAAYKVCWVPSGENIQSSACFTADLMAAMDEAVKDGVDLMSISIVGLPPSNLFSDGMSISSFHAMQRGILVVFAGGNTGPSAFSVDHLEPWSFTVAASSIDRSFTAILQLGESIKLKGETTTRYETTSAVVALGEDLVTDGVNVTDAAHCLPGTLDATRTAGKIVFCLRGVNARSEKGVVVKAAGGVGLIVGNEPENGDGLSADNHVLPALSVTASGSDTVREYVKSNSNPIATLFKGETVMGVRPSPVVAFFSSVGPNLATQDILKPDIMAPGLNILAAWSGAASPVDRPSDDRRVDYNIISGTSMAAPHVSGVVALLKVIHPDWSPAAIKSAIMTTASVLDNTHHRISNTLHQQATPFETGAGHVHPALAAKPGLVYDTKPEDYTIFLCSLGYNDTAVQIITGDADVCSKLHKKIERFPSPSDLNLPSLTVGSLKETRTIRRFVTNVDEKGSTYKVHIVPPQGVSVSIFPSTLKFKAKGETKKFYVTLKPDTKVSDHVFGSYTWYNGKRKVRSTIVVGYN